MWEEGHHCDPAHRIGRFNDEIFSLEGDLTTDEAQIAAAKFLFANPSICVEMLTGVKLYPFQELMLKAMFHKDFFLAVCSRGASKSWLGATFAYLYAIFFPGARIGICSASFRQARNVFKQIEDFANTEKGLFLRQCFNGKPKHLNDVFEMKIGSSVIAALPLGDGGKIRGYRFNVMIIDELLLLSERVINEVIKPFMIVKADARHRKEVEDAETKLIAAGKLREEDRIKFPENKLIGLTSASYEFEYLFDLYSSYKESILDPRAKNVNHAIFQLSCEIIPDGLFDQRQIEDFRKTFSAAQFEREIMAKFTGDSSGYFSARKMMEVTVPSGEAPCVELVGDPGAKYILAIDPNSNDAENSDHFAMCLLKLDEMSETGTLVHCYALEKSGTKARAKYLNYLLENFNIVYVIMDHAGGGRFIQDANEGQFLDCGKLEVMEDDFNNKNWEEGVAKTRGQYMPERHRIVHDQQFTSAWIREANEYMSACIEQRKLWFASAIDAASGSRYEAYMSMKLPMKDLDFSLENYKKLGMSDHQAMRMKQSDFIERQGDLIKLTKDETALIVVRTGPTGNQTFDLPPELTRDRSKPDRVRRDSYTVLLLATWGMKCFFALQRCKPAKKGGFLPHFIG